MTNRKKDSDYSNYNFYNRSSVLLANFDELTSGTYCSYFSNHLPRFCTFEIIDFPQKRKRN